MQDPPIGDSSDHSGPELGARLRARRFAVGLALVVLVGAAAYISTRPLGGSPTASQAGAVGSQAVGSAVVGPGIGQSAPDFVSADARKPLLLNLDGVPIRLGDFAGKPLWIVFWATWCIPCQEEASDIRAAYRGHQSEDLAVLAIDVQEPAAAVRAFARSHDLDYAIGLDPTAAVKTLYGGWGLPSHFFLGANGVIRDRYLGQMTRDLMERHLLAILPPT
jgi:cytochrome c biogenesis protein CcmG, thiol:disulfide interchange protein DsbE